MTSDRSTPSGTLATRLGYGPTDRLLIVNCDDLDSSHSANRRRDLDHRCTLRRPRDGTSVRAARA